MEINQLKSMIEAILFAAGRPVMQKELVLSLEISEEDIENIIASMQEEYKQETRGIEIIKINQSYQLCTKKELYDFILPVVDKRNKPNLSNAALETLAIIAYNPKITRPEIEAIRGVSADACVYKLMEYGLIEEAGKVDLPGKPMSYRTTEDFLRMFGYTSLEDLPELPKYRMDENQQIVIDELVEQEEKEEELVEEQKGKLEAPMPEREEIKEEKQKDENERVENLGNK